MRVRFGLAGWLLLSCTGSGGVQRKEPEICGDGIDNNGDLLIDCEDPASCGGIVCQTQGDDDDSGTIEPPAPLEIVYDEARCCDFDYDPPGDCPTKSIGTVELINRTTDVDATFDVDCALVGPLSAIEFQVVGSSSQPVPFLRGDLYAGTEVTVEAFFVCNQQFDSDFETLCQVLVEADGEDDVQVDINVDAHFAGR